MLQSDQLLEIPVTFSLQCRPSGTAMQPLCLENSKRARRLPKLPLQNQSHSPVSSHSMS